jgi:DDE superfamily endonuclease
MEAMQKKKMGAILGASVMIIVALFKVIMDMQASPGKLSLLPPLEFPNLEPPWMSGVFMDVNMVPRKRKRTTGLWYVFPRNNTWFDNFVKRHWDDSKWRTHFRMTRSHFEMLCEMLAPKLERGTTNWKYPVSVSKQVAVTLMHMAKNSTYDSLSELFGIGISTIHYCIHDVVHAIVAHPAMKITYPDGGRLTRVVKGFRDKHGFPNCVGAIDGTLLRCVRPKGLEGADYFDRKKSFSIAMQAVVGPDCKFLDVYVGWPGAVHDARVLWNSPIRDEFEEGTHKVYLLPSVDLYGCDIGPWLIADGGYACQKWLITPFMEENSRAKRHWNFCHSSTRMVVERTFGIWKTMWRVFHAVHGVCRHKPHMVIMMAQACASLHNWLIEVEEIQVAELPLLDEDDYIGNMDAYINEDLDASASGIEVRNHLYNHICHLHGYDAE